MASPNGIRVFVLSALLIAAGCGSGGERPSLVHARVKTNSLVLVDPGADRVVAVVPLGVTPTRVSYGGGAFWVAAPGDGQVVRVDARTHEVRRFHVGEEPYDVAVGDGAVWISDHDAYEVIRLDPETGATRARDVGGPAVTIGFGAGHVWSVVAPGNLVRLDPETLKVTHTTENVAATTEEAEPKLLLSGDDLLVVSPSSAWVAHVTRDGSLHGKANVNGLTSGALLGGRLWLANSGGFVTSPKHRRIHVGYAPRDIAAADGDVWVSVYNASTLKRIDGLSGRVTATFRLNRAPVAVAAGGGRVAVVVTSQL